MDELIIRSLQGVATEYEKRRLRAWRGARPANERRYKDLRELWSLAGVATPSHEGEPPDVRDLIALAEADVEPEPIRLMLTATGTTDETSPVWSSRSRFRWVGAAAAGALAASLVAIGFGVGPGPDGPYQGDRQSFVADGQIVTGAGEMTTLTLADGTSIRLGPQSRLRVTEDENSRTAWLEGRAFFGVQADSTRPFTVRTDYGEARVLGTRFEVRSESALEEFRVLVVEGEVSVASGGAQVSLSNGEMTRSVGGGAPSTERVGDVYAQLDWLGAVLVFQATPFWRALEEVERQYRVSVDLEDPLLADLTVTATFTDRRLEEVVFVLCEIVNTTCSVQDGTVRVGDSTVRVGTRSRVPSP